MRSHGGRVDNQCEKKNHILDDFEIIYLVVDMIHESQVPN